MRHYGIARLAVLVLLLHLPYVSFGQKLEENTDRHGEDFRDFDFQFALKTSNRHFVTAVNGGGLGGRNDESSPIHTDAKTIGIWERLTLNFLPNNRLTIKVPNGQFLTTVNGGGMIGPSNSPVQTDAAQPADWGTFTLVTLGEASASARTSLRGDQDSRQTGSKQDTGECFDKPAKGSNPANLFLAMEVSAVVRFENRNGGCGHPGSARFSRQVRGRVADGEPAERTEATLRPTRLGCRVSAVERWGACVRGRNPHLVH